MNLRMWMLNLLTIGLLMVIISPALAGKPDDKGPTFEEVKVIHISDQFDFDCGDFIYDWEEDYTFRTTTFYDKDRNMVRFQTHAEFEGTMTNTKTGTVFRSHNKNNNIEYLTGDRGTVEVGTFVKLFAPDNRLVRIVAGIIIFDTSGDFVSFKGVDRPPPGTDFCSPPFSEI